MSAGIVPIPSGAQIPWTTPPVLAALLATNGSIGAAITALLCLLAAFIIYLPFVLAANSQKKR